MAGGGGSQSHSIDGFSLPLFPHIAISPFYPLWVDALELFHFFLERERKKREEAPAQIGKRGSHKRGMEEKGGTKKD